MRRGNMDSREALRYVLSRSNKPKTTVSQELGKSAGYINTYVSMGKVPGLDTMASIANVCGYDLVLVDRSTGETIKIDSKE